MNSETLLFRQVHPNWTKDGRITSQAFKPTPKDKRKLSAYDGDQISAEESWAHYTSNRGLQSAGVVAVTVSECESQQRQVVADPDTFAEHVEIDFTGLSNSRVRDVAAALASMARSRGWLYRPSQNPEASPNSEVDRDPDNRKSGD